MSEPEQQALDPHAALYQQMHENISRNAMLFEHLMSNVIKLLPAAPPQAAEDALDMACVALGKAPLESLLLIHEFLQNYHSIVQHEQPAQQAVESPFLGGQS